MLRDEKRRKFVEINFLKFVRYYKYYVTRIKYICIDKYRVIFVKSYNYYAIIIRFCS